MSEYEKALKTENEILGYRFLYDTVGDNPRNVSRKAASICRVPHRKIKVVLGDCIDGEHEVSRYLVFENVMGL